MTRRNSTRKNMIVGKKNQPRGEYFVDDNGASSSMKNVSKSQKLEEEKFS